jgi:hypothetical protein
LGKAFFPGVPLHSNPIINYRQVVMAAIRTAIDTHQATAPPVANLGSDLARLFSDTCPRAFHRPACSMYFIRFRAFPSTASRLLFGNKLESDPAAPLCREEAE